MKFITHIVATYFMIILVPSSAIAEQCRKETIYRHELEFIDYKEIPTVEAYCQALRAENWCAERCEDRVRDAFNEIKAKRIRYQEEQEAKKAKEKAEAAALAAREAAMRAKTAKPENLREAAIFYNAEHGGSLASAPKIKPDDGMYYMHGKIKFAGEEPEFFAALSSSQENELLASVFRRSRGMGESTDYFGVIIPKDLEKYYFSNAKVEGGFDLVGRYVLNTTYETVSGQKKSAPVFEAIYFVVWQ